MPDEGQAGSPCIECFTACQMKGRQETGSPSVFNAMKTDTWAAQCTREYLHYDLSRCLFLAPAPLPLCPRALLTKPLISSAFVLP
eukprot:1159974-Pelagomonas_calceolata.AAC.1